MAMTRRELWLALMFVAIGIAAWLLRPGAERSTREDGDKERRPDYIVEGLQGIVLGLDGEPTRRLDAERLRHYPDDGSSELDAPVLQVYDEDDEAPPWYARSRLAWINAAGDELLLERDVRLDRAATLDSAPIELRTSELLVLPELDYAETSRFVMVERGQDWVTATDGMRAWFGEGTRIQLFGRVRALIEQRTEDAPSADAPE
jgi:lipopolysaccharide export system protein LptC